MLVIAVLVVSMMTAVGLAIFSTVDVQHRESGTERVRESSLNLDEGVLYAQGFAMAKYWPGSPTTKMPSSCDQNGTLPAADQAKCPDPATLANTHSPGTNFSGVDFADGSTWITKVRDNGGPLNKFYDPKQADATQLGCSATPCSYDANGDLRLWVQATTIVRGRPRSIVAQLQRELLTESVPKYALVTGHFDVSNNGWRGGTPLIDGADSSIGVRCNPLDPNPAVAKACADYKAGQVAPAPQQLPTGSNGPLMTPSQLERLKERAQADGKYYPGCPPNDLRGTVVWVENCAYQKFTASTASNPCPASLPVGLSTQNCINTDASPGVLIWHHGTAEFNGNITYIGLVYAVNGSDDGVGQSTGTVFTVHGGGGVWGAIAIDGNGGLDAGSNGYNVKYNPNVFPHVQSYGTAGLVQNTWRELPPGS